MGLLFTTEGTRRIKNTLNTAFDESPDGLAYIRSFVGTPADKPTQSLKPFGQFIAQRTWTPGQIAVALDLMPYDQGSGDGNQGNGPHHHGNPGGKKDPDTKRWNYFLKTVIGDSSAGINGTKPIDTVFAPLRSALADALLNQDSDGKQLNIVRVSFDHVELDANLENSGTTKQTAPPGVVIFDTTLWDDGGNSVGTVRHITLFTVRVPQNQQGDDFTGSVRITGHKWKT
jgi:hypothetical protein